MNIEIGIVVQVQGNRILVEAESGAGCACCAAKDGCITRDDRRKRVLWMDNTLDAGTGDRVCFRVEERGMILASVLLYLVPVIFLFIGIVAGSYLYVRMGMDQDIAAIILGLAGIVLSFVFIRLVSPRISASRVVQPALVSIEKMPEL